MNTESIPQFSWQAPSNIALIKYWGKKNYQEPINASISFTLSNAVSKMKVTPVEKTDQIVAEFIFENKPSAFGERVEKYIKKNLEFYSFTERYSLKIESENTFPHSTGIASSASSMAALSACLVELQFWFEGKEFVMDQQIDLISDMARRASGSACRSLMGPLGLWGSYDIDKSNQNYAIEWNQVASVFKTYQDKILIVESQEKKVSSSVGHALMEGHPFREQRMLNAKQRMDDLIVAMKDGDIKTFGELIEAEALELHAMMMTSTPSYILMAPNTLILIDKVREFREKSGVPLYFTLDAGPNLHLLYPQEFKNDVDHFVTEHCMKYIESQLDDQVGTGANKVTF